jgi:hypothetical protein
MRLGQLARKLGLKPSEVVLHLATQGISIDENANYRLEDEHTRLVLEHFAPQMLEEQQMETFVSQPEELEKPVTEDLPLLHEPELVVPPTPELKAPITDTVSDQDTIQELPEVIRVPKIELSGLKVLGKIELPEKKKKESTLTEEDATTQKDDAETKPSLHKPVDRKRQRRPSHNSIAAAREREQREAEEKRRQEAERRKQQRTQNYLKKVKANAPVKKVVIQEPVREVMVTPAESPKTLWGKFKKWLFS